MKNLKRFLATVVVTFLVTCFMGTAGLAEECDMGVNVDIADVMIGSSGINWMAKVNYAKMVLSVSRPDGVVFRKTFDSGSTLYFGLSDFGDGLAPDGTYNFEMRVIPSITNKVRGVNKVELPQNTLIQSGSFMVQGGAIITNFGIQETPARPLDVLHYDDVIITGSLCVGFDCANGESFGYDTVKLKENNLRLYFEDTSAGSFPSGDWRIRINDTTSGGASYFAVEDGTNGRTPFRIETGAPTHSLYVEDYGRVGLGTSIPYVELHIVDGDSPTIRLDQDGSSGWTAQRWDLCGNETNFFIRDVTNGSKLCFRIQPNTPSSTLCLKADGKVGIGTWSPAYALEVETTGTAANLAVEQTSGAMGVIVADSNHVFIGAKSNHDFRLIANDSVKMTIEPGGDIGIGLTNPTHLIHLSGGAYSDGATWQPSSSREYKENITNLKLDEAMETLEELNPVKFNYKINKEEDYIGFIAEDVPELVATKERKSMNTMDVVAVLTKVVQEQQKTISELKERIAELEKK